MSGFPSLLTSAGRISQSSHQNPALEMILEVNRRPTAITPSVHVAKIEATIVCCWLSLRSRPGGGGGSDIVSGESKECVLLKAKDLGSKARVIRV